MTRAPFEPVASLPVAVAVGARASIATAARLPAARWSPSIACGVRVPPGGSRSAAGASASSAATSLTDPSVTRSRIGQPCPSAAGQVKGR